MQHYSIETLLNRRVVMDTQGPLIYIGTLAQIDAAGYWLIDADVHDRHDGHSSKEIYINEARELERHGSRNVNRRRVFVERAAIVSLSALEDVVAEAQSLEREEPR